MTANRSESGGITQSLGSSAPHLVEIAEILAAGFTRVIARKSSGKNQLIGESSLDFSAGKSGDPTPVRIGGPDD